MQSEIVTQIHQLWGNVTDEVDPKDTSQYSDGLAIFSIVVLFLTIAGVLGFLVYVNMQKEIDQRNHPYH